MAINILSFLTKTANSINSGRDHVKINYKALIAGVGLGLMASSVYAETLTVVKPHIENELEIILPLES